MGTRMDWKCGGRQIIAWIGIFPALLLPPCVCCGQDTKSPAKAAAKSGAVASEKNRPVFDLTYVPPAATGVIAIRPNAVFRDSAMQPFAHKANEALAPLLQLIGVSKNQMLPVQEIEQVIAFIYTRTVLNKGAPAEVENEVPGVIIRVAHDYDWQKIMRQIDPEAEELRFEDQVHYRFHVKGIPDKPTLQYHIPDKRTLFLLLGTYESADKKPGKKVVAVLPNDACMPLGKGGQRPTFFWDKEWKHVQRDLFAVALDNRWAAGVSEEQIGGVPGWASYLQTASTMVAGIDDKNGIDFHAYLVGKDDAATQLILRNVLGHVAEWQNIMKQPPTEEISERAVQVVKDLAEHARVRRHESTVRVHTTVKNSLADVTTAYLEALNASLSK